MKVIELISKLINGEEVPNKIKYDNAIWEYSKDSNDYYSYEWLIVSYLGRIELSEFINDEIEIIEENKPIEKIFGNQHPSTEDLNLIREDIGLAYLKIDEIIDTVNELKKGNE